ncbi:hypothetical protein PGT21_016642 [Puccinia graminis f. sp. tritici]|uniref:Uncharacterized protein n=1 Tax=Puccinia graminis f. sp. tritici TaxID=56615 RepID=A0A5B0PRW3_PUCGR|nr:hypothetical protein PGT21_016642 [Puccinia graminis f. sp. tritici]
MTAGNTPGTPGTSPASTYSSRLPAHGPWHVANLGPRHRALNQKTRANPTAMESSAAPSFSPEHKKGARGNACNILTLAGLEPTTTCV